MLYDQEHCSYCFLFIKGKVCYVLKSTYYVIVRMLVVGRSGTHIHERCQATVILSVAL